VQEVSGEHALLVLLYRLASKDPLYRISPMLCLQGSAVCEVFNQMVEHVVYTFEHLLTDLDWFRCALNFFFPFLDMYYAPDIVISFLLFFWHQIPEYAQAFHQADVPHPLRPCTGLSYMIGLMNGILMSTGTT